MVRGSEVRVLRLQSQDGGIGIHAGFRFQSLIKIGVQLPFLVMSRPNMNQWFKKSKGQKTTKPKSVGLRGCPQKRGVCLKIFVCSPKKPNSARRKVAKVRLSNKVRLTAYIPGQVHRLQEHSQVLIRGGRVPDLPGVKYRLIRNKLDLEGLLGRKTSRSKYGTKKKDKER